MAAATYAYPQPAILPSANGIFGAGNEGIDSMVNGNTSKHVKDGAQPKRRGPKPDSKPALTRRQELNRQAQRTHRERKEQYIKALEQRIFELTELFTGTTRERDAAISDNQRLRDLLKAHGIQYDLATPATSSTGSSVPYNSSVSDSFPGSCRQDSYTTLTQSPSSLSARSPIQSVETMLSPRTTNSRLDYDQIGIDFVLALEKPCMEHIQYLVVRSHNVDNQFFHHPMERTDDMDYDHMSGHALMATCPPLHHVMEKPGEPYPHKLPDLARPDLKKLLQASSMLPTGGGEVTPVQAWMMILGNDRLGSMTKRDFDAVLADLMTKVRCYGFGAVIEEFEIRDALDSVFASRDFRQMSINSFGSQMSANSFGSQVSHQCGGHAHAHYQSQIMA